MSEVALIVGGDSFLGHEMRLAFLKAGLDVYATSRQNSKVNREKVLHLDLADRKTPAEILRLEPRVVVFNGAMTSHQACRSHPRLSKQINVSSVLRMAEEFAHQNSKLLFISSNAVFDGMSPHAVADMRHCPESLYGAYKAEAELQLTALDSHVCIIRFSKLSHSLKPLIRDWVHSLANGDVIKPFSDAVVAPIRTKLAATAVMAAFDANFAGVLQLSAAKDLAYSELGKSIAKLFGFPSNLVIPTVATPNKEVSFPRHTTLDSQAFFALNIQQPDPLECLVDFRNLASGP